MSHTEDKLRQRFGDCPIDIWQCPDTGRYGAQLTLTVEGSGFDDAAYALQLALCDLLVDWGFEDAAARCAPRGQDDDG